MMTSALKDQRGFTLVELVVVVSIIGVLTGIAVPHLAKAWDDAKASACKANMKQIEAALELYYFEHGEYPAAASESSSALEKLELKSVPVCPQSKSGYSYTPTGTKNIGYKLECAEHEFSITDTTEEF